MVEGASGGDMGERRDGSGTNGRTRVRKPLGASQGRHQKGPEVRRAPWRGRVGPHWLAPKEGDFSETILEEKE